MKRLDNVLLPFLETFYNQLIYLTGNQGENLKLASKQYGTWSDNKYVQAGQALDKPHSVTIIVIVSTSYSKCAMIIFILNFKANSLL